MLPLSRLERVEHAIARWWQRHRVQVSRFARIMGQTAIGFIVGMRRLPETLTELAVVVLIPSLEVAWRAAYPATPDSVHPGHRFDA